MGISDHSYAGLLMKKRRNVEQKETENIQSGKKGVLRNVIWESRTVLGKMRSSLKGSATEGGKTSPAKLPVWERRRPKGFSVPKKNNKSKLLRVCLRGARVHPTFAVQLDSVDLMILALKS